MSETTLAVERGWGRGFCQEWGKTIYGPIPKQSKIFTVGWHCLFLSNAQQFGPSLDRTSPSCDLRVFPGLSVLFESTFLVDSRLGPRRKLPQVQTAPHPRGMENHRTGSLWSQECPTQLVSLVLQCCRSLPASDGPYLVHLDIHEPCSGAF